MSILIFLAGIVLTIIGAEFLVRGASKIAAKLGVSAIVIGLTVVAFGTSAPEFAVSVDAALKNQADVAVGNVVGSNIFNLMFILGLTALITPLTVHEQLIKLDLWIMLGAVVIAYSFCRDGAFVRWEGIVLFAGILIYCYWNVRQSRKSPTLEISDEHQVATRESSNGIVISLIAIIGGLALLVVGARFVVAGAIDIAKALGVSDFVIACTIVAAGTSLPEVATSVVAALRRERDIAVGNVVGSNIFNVFAVLGGASAISQTGIRVNAAAISVDMPVLMIVSVLAIPMFVTGKRLDRWEGALLLGGYVAYTVYQVRMATSGSA